MKVEGTELEYNSAKRRFKVQPDDEIEIMLSIESEGENVTKDVIKDITKELSEHQIVMINMMQENPLVTISEMSHKIGVATRTIIRELSSLQEKGVISQEGSSKEGKWIIRATD